MPPSWPPRANLGSRLQHAAGRFALRQAGLSEIVHLSTLGEWLRRPGSILCLGNGPSSEDRHVPCDSECLFRVNWVWRERGLLTDPDVVFTADPDQPAPDSRAILGFPTTADAVRILRGHQRAGRAHAAWFAVSTLAPKIAAPQRAAYPTNGALMIAVAAALDPARLTIAGIDLYRHADGKYPGATDEPNAYAEIHDPAVDLAVIGAALSAYRGALTILSANLREALAR